MPWVILTDHIPSHSMPQLTDLVCRIILFAKFNMLINFNLHSLVNIEGGICPHIIFQWSKRIVSITTKYRETFFKKFFMADGGQTFVGKFIGVLFYIRCSSKGSIQLFKDSPAKRKDYVVCTGSNKYPLFFCTTRYEVFFSLFVFIFQCPFNWL